MKIRESLSARRPDLHARLQVIESKAKQLLEYSQGGTHLTFTTHGLSHISAVEENYDWLLSEEDIVALNPMESLCLLSATFFHDALMIPANAGDEPKARRDHAARARAFLMKNSDLVGLTVHEVNAIAEIIRGHAVEDFRDLSEEIVIGSTLISIRKLAACLSMADICHADSSRVPEIVFRHLEMDEESAYHWRRHLQISGITRKSERIIMSALCFSNEGSRAVADYAAEIDRQLVKVRPYFQSLLQPISGVDLQEQRLKSQLDVAMRFQANTRAILDILIEGVYQRQDVFVRELIQNSLDACHLRLAKSLRRGEQFSPRIVVSLLAEGKSVRAVRVDDNGIGMDVRDIQDIVLWIGNSVSQRPDVQKLLSDTTGKQLIATFGIGLLSCFKAARSVTLTSAKEARNPVQIQITSLSDEIRPVEATDSAVGSTFIVELRDEVEKEIDLEAAVRHYFRMVQQASIELLHLDWGTASTSYTRDQIFKMATTEAKEVTSSLPRATESALVFHQLKSEDFIAWLWIPMGAVTAFASEGTLEILNEGVYISTDPTTEWLPGCFGFCQGVINFSARAVDLPVSRDKVISNKKMSGKRAILAKKSVILVERLVEATKLTNIADKAVLTLAYCFGAADEEMKERILRRLESYHARVYQRERNMPLARVRETEPPIVYLEYSEGRYVKELTTFDNRMLYYQPDDLTQLQAALLRQNGQIVLSGKRGDEGDKPILEASLLAAYFKSHEIPTVDLTKEQNVVSGLLRGKPLPKSSRRGIKKEVKFVEVTGLPNKRSWKVGNETWVNVANSQMGQVYEVLQTENISQERLDLAEVLFDLLAHRFEQVLGGIINLILTRTAESSQSARQAPP